VHMRTSMQRIVHVWKLLSTSHRAEAAVPSGTAAASKKRSRHNVNEDDAGRGSDVGEDDDGSGSDANDTAVQVLEHRCSIVP
jgi:hypothetical protein